MSIFGKLFTTAFLSIFVVVGIFFATQIFKDTDRKIDQQGWVEHPATIVSSRVDIDSSTNEPYVPQITYTYDYLGQTYTSTTITDNEPATRDYADAQAYILAYPAGSATNVFVNPNDPSDAILNAGSLDALGSAAFGAIFLSMFTGIPLLIIIGMWWPKRGRSGKDERAAAAKKRGKENGRLAGVIFGALFTAIGVGMFIFMTVLPLVRTAMSQSWSAVPCVIERSDVLRFDDGDDGPTYRIDILYKYEVGGQTYGSNRFSFAQLGSSSGREGKQDVVNQYPVGSQHTCFVHPDDPTRAVLHRGLTLANLWGLFPIPFAAAGLFVLFYTLKQGKQSNSWRPDQSKSKGLESHESWSSRNGGSVVLNPRKSRRKNFIGMLIFAVFWNGITGVLSSFFFIGPVIAGDWEWAPAIFFTIFHLIGLGVLIGAINKFMVMFAPAVVVELSRQAVPIGGSAELRWRIPGASGKVERVTITLIGEESATYTRGTDTVTDTEVFYEHVLVGGENETGVPAYRSPGRLSDSGDAMVLIPQDTMHSFEAMNNKIVWRLEVRAEVPRWPDPKDKYPFTVLPMQIEGA